MIKRTMQVCVPLLSAVRATPSGGGQDLRGSFAFFL